MLPAFEKAVNEPHARCCDRCSDANQAAWIHVISVRMPFLDPFLLILYINLEFSRDANQWALTFLILVLSGSCVSYSY